MNFELLFTFWQAVVSTALLYAVVCSGVPGGGQC